MRKEKLIELVVTTLYLSHTHTHTHTHTLWPLFFSEFLYLDMSISFIKCFLMYMIAHNSVIFALFPTTKKRLKLASLILNSKLMTILSQSNVAYKLG
jgi:hypothetical protein